MNNINLQVHNFHIWNLIWMTSCVQCITLEKNFPMKYFMLSWSSFDPFVRHFTDYFSQITNLFINHSFGNKIWFKSSNGECNLILEIFFSSHFQRSKEGPTWTRFGPNKLCFKNFKHYKISIPKWGHILKFYDFLSCIIPHLYNYVFKSQYIFPIHSLCHTLT